ncbi:SPOSA6832_02089 [Sporobolomyces salmonicolor]|uniref:SPOSA6832_02089-mRNA-1:cds n=1 Tax=Sporidiobolus salmonicolor TaxID=5005 RepID=A0A0D6EL49_SPOSA|nr:SPOSA6832_02089 [Sporobolomyces salmonicolor]
MAEEGDKPLATSPSSSPGPWSSREANAPPPYVTVVVGSAAVALIAFLLLLWTDTVHLPHTPSSYYLATLMADPPPRTLRVGTFNIRYSPPASAVLQPLKSLAASVTTPKNVRSELEKWGERPWSERREKLVDQVLWSELDVVGYQEVLDHQLQDVEKLMGEEWAHVGVGRNDGKRAGEAVPIFYRRSRFDLISSKHAWLSPTPSKPGSRGWDAGQPRMVTLVRLRDKQSRLPAGEDYLFANTHWDDRGLEARTQSAELILSLVQEEAANKTQRGGPDPLVVLLGDLNSPAEEKGYRILTGNRPFGPINTFTGFVPSDIPKVIDFILLYANSAFAPPSPPPSTSSSETAILDADDPDEVLSTLNAVADAEEKQQQALVKQPRWKVARYGVVPNFFEDVGGRRPPGSSDALLVSDHRLVVVALEEVVAS